MEESNLHVAIVLLVTCLGQNSWSCSVLRIPWRSTSINNLSAGLVFLGPTPNVSEPLTLGECAQWCLDHSCKMFLHAPAYGRCFLSTKEIVNCSEIEQSSVNTGNSARRNVLFTWCLSECNSSSILPLGMESGEVSDSALSASVDKVSGKLKLGNSRLNHEGGWSSLYERGLTSHNYWLAVALNRVAVIHRIATQGCSFCVNRWVRAFSLQYSSDNINWQIYKQNGQKKIFDGNTDNNGIVYNEIDPPIVTQHIKIYTENITVLDINGEMSAVLGFRFELYGCWL